MIPITRKRFLTQASLMGASLVLFNNCQPDLSQVVNRGIHLDKIRKGEDVFAYILRKKGKWDLTLYRQVIGAANAFKEGDLTLGVAADSEASRQNARELLTHTTLKDLMDHNLYEDEIEQLIRRTTVDNPEVHSWTMGELKNFVLEQPEPDIKAIMPALTSDSIACLVKLMSNGELIRVGQKIFNPLPGTKIGSKGYMSARIQPNSPTDNIEDITWQVFDAWSYAVGDLVLGTNPVSSEPQSVARIEAALFDILSTFELQEALPNCVLSHIDIQAEVEDMQPGTTGIWFQSLAGTVNANQTFDVTVEKMFSHAAQRLGPYGLYAETGQGADFTNGHGEGFDMVVHESRKYGFLRALKQEMSAGKPLAEQPWVHVNDVAGFIGPEVFRSREQLVRCCLEDTVMGKLHGLTIGLDICSTLHMDVDLDDLDWCIEQVMPANPAYLMALPTKNDPMLSYLTTAYHDHVRIREKFGYKVNDVMWEFFQDLEVVDSNGKPTEHFGDPIWVYYKYRKAKGDSRSEAEIYVEGKQAIESIRGRGVPIAEGYGAYPWEMHPDLAEKVRYLYKDAKESLWTEMDPAFQASIPEGILLSSQATDRKDYIYHPESGETLSREALKALQNLRKRWANTPPDVQIVISDGLNARALMDEGHLIPFLEELEVQLKDQGYRLAKEKLVFTYGRVRTGYATGEQLFGSGNESNNRKGIIHIIGERPGSGHHNFSVYLTVATQGSWGQKGKVDHNISRVISGISDTALRPEEAVLETVNIFKKLWEIASS
ncbi:MAG: ethanolamine ammonia-lyase subunit EutB [Bacteroidota bacterium]